MNRKPEIGQRARHDADTEIGVIVQIFDDGIWRARVQYANGGVQDIESWHLVVLS